MKYTKIAVFGLMVGIIAVLYTQVNQSYNAGYVMGRTHAFIEVVECHHINDPRVLDTYFVMSSNYMGEYPCEE